MQSIELGGGGGGGGEEEKRNKSILYKYKCRLRVGG
jgi:hypothetical protein